MGITELIAAGKEFGIFEFYLPFILMFAVLFSILQRVKIFGDPEKGGRGINIIISLVASLFVMAYTPIGINLAQFFANLFGQALVVILSIAVFAVVLVVTTGKGIGEFFGARGIFVVFLAILALAAGVFFSSGGAAFFPGLKVGLTLPNFGISPQTLAILLVVVITGIIIYFLTKGGEKPAGKGPGG